MSRLELGRYAAAAEEVVFWATFDDGIWGKPWLNVELRPLVGERCSEPTSRSTACAPPQ